MQFEYRIADRYNWDTGKGVNVLGFPVKDKDIGEFHRQGLAREFNMSGWVRKTIRWKKGHVPINDLGW